MKSVKMFGKSVPLIAILLVSILTVGTFAAVLLQYATVEMTAEMEQSVLLEGKATSVTDTLEGIGGRTYCYPHTLENQGHKEAPIDFTWGCDIDSEGITVSYLKPLDYKTTVTLSTYSIPAVITVEPDSTGDYVMWKIDMDETKYPVFAYGGHIAFALVISEEGVQAGVPSFQVHSNDGTDHFYKFGTHLFSAYTDTWHTGWSGTGERTANNIPVADIDWIDASGAYLTADNPDGVFTVSIKKCYLGEKFSWAVQLMGSTSDTIYPTGWSKWSSPSTGLAVVEIAKDIKLYTLGMLETLDFYIVYDFNIALTPGTYTITSTVNVG